MEKAMAPHSSTLAWRIPWMEERGGLQSMGLWRIRHDWATSLWLFTFMHWRRKWQPTLVLLPGESQQQRSLVGCCLWGHTESPWLKRLSSSSNLFEGFPCGSAGKESTCNVGDLGLIPGLGRSPGKWKGYPLQYSGLGNYMDQSMGSQRVEHDWVTFTLTSLNRCFDPLNLG